ncbi:hypothetical protein B1987_13715 [Mycobacterium kansasii]|nr:hypothetical protein B1987_13715 [Mycobacterium kansasii]
MDRYVAFPHRHHAVVVVLWIVHTWVVHAFYVTPRLILDSAEPGSGKTRVLELLALLCRSAKLTLSTTTAALYRRIAAAADAGQPPPTVLQDEADAIFGKNTTPQAEDLRALFNAGYKKGATVDRCEGDAARMRVREFPVWAPLALAGLVGRMPDTITSRGVTVHMRRRRPDQKLADFRERDAQVEVTPIREQLTVWAGAAEDVLSAARPPMPDGVTDRAAEIWEPLLAIADLAGGHWSAAARAACTYFVVDSAGEDEKLSLGQRLLRDIKKLLKDEDATAMWSSDIIRGLTVDAESEWRDLWGKSLDQRRLAKELGRYGVKSKNVRVGVAVSKGYEIDGPAGLAQAWDTWLTPSMSATSATPVTTQLDGLQSVADADLAATAATEALHTKTASQLQPSGDVAAVAAVALTNGVVEPDTGDRPPKCPECQRAPARSDTRLCDFCTVKHRRQQTAKGRPTLSCQKWFNNHIAELRAAGQTTADSFAVNRAGEAAGYTRSNLSQAASAHPDVVAINRTSRGATWSITGDRQSAYVPAPDFFAEYLRNLPANATQIDQADYQRASAAAGYGWESATKAATKHPRIESVPAAGNSRNDRIWMIKPAANEGEAS